MLTLVGKWEYTEQGFVIGAVTVFNDIKILMEQVKIYTSLDSFIEYIAKTFIKNVRFKWGCINVSIKKQYLEVEGEDKRQAKGRGYSVNERGYFQNGNSSKERS